MSENLRQLLEQAASKIKSPQPDYGDVIRGGQRRLWTRRLGGSSLVAALLAGGWLVALNLPSPDRVDSDTIQPAAEQTIANVPNSRVATFAVRGIAQARLLDPLGEFNDYSGVEETTGGWLVDFEALVCGSTTCDPNPGGNTQLAVQQHGDQLVIAAASGPFGEETRQALLNYQEQATPENVGLTFPTVRIQGSADEGASVVASPLWTGPIPADSVQVECHLRITDRNGAVVFQRALDEPLPQIEEMRAGTKFIFGFPANLGDQADRADIDCSTKP